MRILSLETATYFGGVGYLAPGARECAGPFSPRGASKEILAAVHKILERRNCPLEELDLIAVSTGPGLFTGLRVGLAIAKTLVWARGGKGRTALAEVPTLEAVAALALEGESPVREGDLTAAVTDARRGEVYAALFRVCRGEEENAPVPGIPSPLKTADSPERTRKGGSSPGSLSRALALRRLGEDLAVRPDLLAERLFSHEKARDFRNERVWLIGDGVERYEKTVRAAFGRRGETLSCREGNPAFQVAELGRRSFLAAGRGARPDEVQPHYVRRPDARRPAVVSFLSNEKET